MKKGFPTEIRIIMNQIYHGYCCVPGCYSPVHSYHHKLPETEYYMKKFPLFIHSPFNCAPVCEKHHVNHRSLSFLNISEIEAQAYEEWLERLIKEGN